LLWWTPGIYPGQTKTPRHQYTLRANWLESNFTHKVPRLRDGTPLDASRMIVLLFLHTYIYTDQKVVCFKLIG